MFQLILSDCTHLSLSELKRKHTHSYSAEEAATAGACESERDSILHLGGRIFLREALSALTGITPLGHEIRRAPCGKPYMRAPQDAEIHFNISHSWPLLVVGIARGHEIGVDIENENRAVDPLRIAARFFSPEERTALQSVPVKLQRYEFFRLWTLKEAVVKATGQGLHMPLDSFTVITKGEAPDLTLVEGISPPMRLGHQLQGGYHLAWAIGDGIGSRQDIRPEIQHLSL